jgi:hypothetical protein
MQGKLISLQVGFTWKTCVGKEKQTKIEGYGP